MNLTSEETVYIQYYPEKIVIVKDPLISFSKKKKMAEVLEKNRKKETNGFMSDATSRKVRKILVCWQEALNSYSEVKKRTPNLKKRKLIFVTLTLSSRQIHDDIWMKRNLLDPYLIKIRRLYPIKYHFWKAEKQENGNIHFHILFDCFIPMKEIQKTWNDTQRLHGYTKDYNEKYGFGEPPSTKIRSAYDDKETVEYMIKYTTKSEKDKIEKGNKIKGRIWGCSDELKNLKPYSTAENGQLLEKLEQMELTESVKSYEDVFFKVYFLDTKRVLGQLNLKWQRDYEDYYIGIYKKLYIKQESCQSDLIESGRDEAIFAKVVKKPAQLSLFSNMDEHFNKAHFFD